MNDKCKNGHPKDESYISSSGTTICRTCRYNRIKRHRTVRLKKLIGNGGIL